VGNCGVRRDGGDWAQEDESISLSESFKNGWDRLKRFKKTALVSEKDGILTRRKQETAPRDQKKENEKKAVWSNSSCGKSILRISRNRIQTWHKPLGARGGWPQEGMKTSRREIKHGEPKSIGKVRSEKDRG